MLKSLAISNYALIESLEISFPDGLIIITGETGAGKSILLGAVSLLLGGKADKDILKDSEKNCVVEAAFTIERGAETDAVFAANSLEPANEIILRRVVSPTGRTRSFVNDEPVSIQFLKDISEKIIDIHAQHEHLLIGDSRFQLSVLDSFAGNSQLLERYQDCWTKVKKLQAEQDSLLSQIAKEEQEIEYNRFQFKQLEEAKLIQGELEDKEAEFNLLSNAGEIKSSLFQIIELLNPAGTSFVQNLKEITGIAQKNSRALPVLEQLSERIEVCRIEIKEIEREISSIAEKVSVDPERAAQLEQRLSFLYDLLKRYRVERVDELLVIKDQISDKLVSGENMKERLSVIQDDLNKSVIEMELAAEVLSCSRREAAFGFASGMQDSIRELEMPHAIFEVRVEQSVNCEYYGKDTVNLYFSANNNIPSRELSKVASGGELSRIMLCLKAIMARGKGMPTMIFDEIDTGVSGSIADKMGTLIGDLSGFMQVFAITHLPQIASKGDCHLLVYKENQQGSVVTKIRKIENEERILEIARMLSGKELTQAAIANAKVFLSK